MRQVLFHIPVPGTDVRIPVFGYGFFVFLGFVIACWLAARRARARGLPPERIVDLGIAMLLFGVLGGRLFWLVMFRDQVRSLYDVIALWEGGLVLYGGVIGGVLAFFVFSRLFQLPRLQLVDILAPAVILGVGIGRIGCLMNGCCWGDPTLLPWGVQFPIGSPPYNQHLEEGLITLGFEAETGGGGVYVGSVLPGSWAEKMGLRATDRIVAVGPEAGQLKTVRHFYELLRELAHVGPGHGVVFEILRQGETTRLAGVFRPVPPGSLPVHPTQLYSFAGAALIAAFLCFAGLEQVAEGLNGPALMLLYGGHRFVIEILRDDLPAAALGLTVAQWISLALIVTALPIAWGLVRRARTASQGP